MDEKGLSIADVARMCDLTDSTVRSVVDRQQKKVALNVAFKLSNGLGVSLERLNGEPEENIKKEPTAIPSDGLYEIDSIFARLSSDNRSKLTELALLYLDAQHKTEDTE